MTSSQDETSFISTRPAEAAGDGWQSLVPLNRWRDYLEHELRQRSVAFGDIDWPVDLEAMPSLSIAIDIPGADAIKRTEVLYDLIQVFVAVLEPTLATAIPAYEFTLGANIQALVLVERQGTEYQTKLIQLEHIDAEHENQRLLIYQRAADTDLFTVTCSDTNGRRVLQQLTPSMLLLQVLALHYGVAVAGQRLVPSDEPTFLRTINALRNEFDGERSAPLLRLFRIYFISPQQLDFVHALLRAAWRVVESQLEQKPSTSVQQQPTLLLQRESTAVAETAPAEFDAGDILALITALYIMLRSGNRRGLKWPSRDIADTTPPVNKRKISDTLVMSDAAIDRWHAAQLVVQTTSATPYVKGQIINL